MRSAFRDLLSDQLGLACHHLKIERPSLQDIGDYEKLAYRIGQVYGMPDSGASAGGGRS